MSQERAHRKPIPKSLDKWQNELDGLLRLKSDLPKLEGDEGKAWARSMGAYVNERIAVLKANKPKRPRRGRPEW